MAEHAYEYHFEAGRSRSPVLLYLHGYGESGGNLHVQVTNHGPWPQGKRVRNGNVQNEISGFFRVAPHLAKKGDTWDTEALAELLAEIATKYESQIDPTHLFVAGISRGGWGALDLVAALGDKITAAAIFCPEKVTALEAAVGKAPVYLFHASDDTIVRFDPPRRNIYDKVAGRADFRFRELNLDQTFLDENGAYHPHVCWTHIFGHPQLYTWFELMKAEPRPAKDRWPEFATLPFQAASH